jgi:DnaK suppressor protein
VNNAPVEAGAHERGENAPQPSNPASGDRGFIADGTNSPIPSQQRTDIDVEYFRGLLFQERSNLESERDAIRARGQDMEGALPEDGESGEEDTADLATAIMDKEFDMSVEDEIEESLAQIDRALQKIDEGTYGICDMSGENIPAARLELIPYALTPEVMKHPDAILVVLRQFIPAFTRKKIGGWKNPSMSPTVINRHGIADVVRQCDH